MWACVTTILEKLPHVSLNGSANGVYGSAGSMGAADWSNTLSELERYRSYTDDWDGQGAKGIPREAIDAGMAIVDVLRANAIVPPNYVLPGFDGTVGFEWRIHDGGSITLDISGPGSAEFERYVPGGAYESIKFGETVPA